MRRIHITRRVPVTSAGVRSRFVEMSKTLLLAVAIAAAELWVLPAARAADAGPSQAPAAQSPANGSPDLPAVDVTPHVIHPVPDGGGPGTPPPPPPRAMALPPAPRYARAPPAPNILSGTAEPLGGVVLSVLGRPLRLFGVRTPAPDVVCATPAGPPRPCNTAAQSALETQLGARVVTCAPPPGQRGVPGYVCHDAAGTDLADFLVAQGLAIADTRQSYAYFNTETKARAAQRGLWHSR
jgi:endonuclease YncB( thermonuclease family)